MGTTTFYLKNNDIGRPLNKMTKEELEQMSKVYPYGKDHYYLGWNVPMEPHNGNIYVLVFWKGRLMKLADAPDILNKKYYDRHSGKTLREYEWTLLKKLILSEIDYLDKDFRKKLRKQNP